MIRTKPDRGGFVLSLLTDNVVDPDCLMAVIVAQAMNMAGTSDIFPSVGAYRVIGDKLIEFKGRVSG